MPVLGTQTVIDLYGCSSAALNDLDSIREVMLEAARRAGATIVDDRFHYFSPHGVSGFVILAESHLAIHTWPECGYAAVDLFTCGTAMTPEACVAYLVERLCATHHTCESFGRGEIAVRRIR